MSSHGKFSTLSTCLEQHCSLNERALGDIDGKYSVVDPLLEISYYPAAKNDLPLTGVTKINPSNDRAPEEIVEADRERVVQSAERARSAPAPFKDTNMTSSTRPMTSSSWVTGSLGTRDDERQVHHSLLTSASHASIKRLAFTSPAVKVGPADVRDEIMDEIVNKPLVFHRNNFKSQSAPPSGRIASSILKSAGTRSTKWVVSPKRARSSFHRRRRGVKSWEKNPGPFMTVKVTGKDLWVVSNSTPTSYFTNNRDDGLRESSGMNGTKVAKWEDTAEAVPKAEQASLPRHERLLGAPAQFAPSIQWLRYDPSAPPRKPPVLTPFKEGRYYNLESNQCRKVTQHLDASPGVRIARNGEVLSHTMKIETLDEFDHESQKESESDGSDIDVASLIPAKLAAKIKKHYGTPENQSDDDEDEGDEEEEEVEVLEMRDSETNPVKDENLETVNDVEEEEDETNNKESQHTANSEDISELSSMSEDELNEAEGAKSGGDEPKSKGPMLTKDSLALLTKLAGQDSSHPIIDGSNGSATSFEESLESYELNDFLEQNGINFDSPRMANGHSEQDDVWRILENATPNFWITKSKQQKLAILKRLRRQRKSEQIASTRESLKSAKAKEEINEVILPLCWEDELNKANTKLVIVSSGAATPVHQNGNTSLPVVFHKTIRYDGLPTATVNAPLKPALPSTIGRPQQRSEGITVGFKPTRGYRAPVSTPRSNRSVRSKSASSASSASAASLRGHSAPNSIVNGSEIIRQSIDLADLLRVTPDSFPAKTPHVMTRTHSVKKERVTIVHDDASEKDIHSVQNETARHMKSNGEDPNVSKAQTAPALSARFSDKRVSAPVGTLNLAGVDTDTTIDTMTFSSQRPSDLKSSSFVSPLNTPKTPMIHHSVALTPKNSARGHRHEPIRLGVESEEDFTKPDEGQQEGLPLTSKPMSALVQEHGGSARTPQSGRTRGGFASVPISQSRLKSGSSRGPTPHFGVTGPRPMKALPNAHSNFANGNTDLSMTVPTVQMGTQNLTAIPNKTADFIQITQSLHISDRSGVQGDAPVVTGNKMYDSYMRELAAHAGEVDDRVDAKGVLVGRGLGGTSGKSSGFSLPRSVKKNLSVYRQPQAQSANMSPFTPQAGRRLGLTMVPQDNSQKVGPFGLGVKGDQVRLNIDKNIHNIYRDLGLLKNNSAPRPEQRAGSPGRSLVSSARSRATHKEDSVISIPTASEPSVANAPVPASAGVVQENGVLTPDEAKTKRPSSSNPSVIVQDSGTQWSSRTVKFEDDDARDSQTTQHQNVNGHAEVIASILPDEKKGDSASIEEDYHSTAMMDDVVSPKGANQTETPQKQDARPRDSAGESHSPTSERSLVRAISRQSDAVSVTDSNVSATSQPAPAVQRSASETLLDRLAEMGDREESSDATEEEIEENEEVDVKGVTRVTVNIPVNSDPVS